jgi:hypothetical protein
MNMVITPGQNPFGASPYTYNVNDVEPLIIEFDPATVGTKTTSVDCGSPIVELRPSATLANSVFTVEPNSRLIVGPTTNPEDAGTFNLKYHFYFSNAPENYISGDFVVNVLTSCESLDFEMYAPDIDYIEYVVGQEAIRYTPEWTSSPANCASSISGDGAALLFGNGGVAAYYTGQTTEAGYNYIHVFYDNDLDLAANSITGKITQVTITAKNPQGSMVAATFDFKVINPCMHSSYMDLSTLLMDFEYTIGSSENNKWTH